MMEDLTWYNLKMCFYSREWQQQQYFITTIDLMDVHLAPAVSTELVKDFLNLIYTYIY